MDEVFSFLRQLGWPWLLALASVIAWVVVFLWRLLHDPDASARRAAWSQSDRSRHQR